MAAAAQLEARLWSDRVTAFLAVAGVVNGTPLASGAEKYYRMLLEKLPLNLCPPSDGGGIQSLTYQAAATTAHAFLNAKKPYRTYSITAVAAPSTVNPALRLSYEVLKNRDRRNDGQVLVVDAIIPGSTFLGSFNADHWSIALPFEESKAFPITTLVINNHFPRHALISSILDFVNMDGGREQE